MIEVQGLEEEVLVDREGLVIGIVTINVAYSCAVRLLRSSLYF